MSRGRVHVVGAGLAGLAAAVDLAAHGWPVVLYESGTHAGGRCRSFFDAELGLRIDNGNHLLLSGNTAALAYVRQIRALDTFEAGKEAAIPFVDLATGERWTVRPSHGAVPWWVFSAGRRVPGTRASDYLSALGLRRAAPAATVAQVLSPDTMLFRRLWQPVTVAALNTAAEDASAQLLWRILVETLGRGAEACRPLLAREGLSESLVDPALAFLAECGAEVRFGALLRRLGFAEHGVIELSFDAGTVALSAADAVILAVPAAIAARLVPGLVVPDDYAPIVNAHFRYPRCNPPPRGGEGTNRGGAPVAPSFIGLVGGTAEWVLRKHDVVSVTVSAADRIVDRPAEELREALWRDVAATLDQPALPVPPARIVKERRATFRATPEQLVRRPAAATRWNNLHLAGDYVDTGLPATIEGAIRSGLTAAARVRRDLHSVLALHGDTPARPPPKPIEGYQRALP
jgi:squalene-associated FAD-dependent desaturase